MIKTIIFDNNGVLSQSSWTGGVDDLIEFLNVDKETFVPIWEEEAVLVDKGEITTEEFLKSCLRKLGLDKTVNLDDFRKKYHEGYKAHPEVRSFAKKLRKDFEIVLLTNFGSDFKYFDKKWNMEEIFDQDKIFVSADLGMIKPDKDIYLYTLKKIGKKPEEVIFIDDKQENIDTAGKLGMHTILFKSLEQVEKDLANILQYDYV